MKNRHCIGTHRYEKVVDLRISFLFILCSVLFTSCGIFSSDAPFDGGKGTVENPYQISTAAQLQRIGEVEYLDKHFIQIKNIDALVSTNFNNEEAFKPIGTEEAPFTGSYNGNGFSISELSLKLNEKHTGLFGYVKDSLIENVILINSDDTNCSFEKLRIKALKQQGYSHAYHDVNSVGNDISTAGWLVGYNDGGMIRSSSSTGYFAREGIRFIGGLVGYNTGLIENSHTTSHSSSLDAITGGFAGGNTGVIKDSYATGCAASAGTAGGLVGYNNGGEILNSYATGDTFANSITGGLVAFNLAGGQIKTSFSSGKMMGVGSVAGGLAGINHGKIEDSYTIKNFSESTQAKQVGGVVGINKPEGTITNSYSAGKLASDPGSTIGGVAGLNEGLIESSYWDMTATGVNTGTGSGNVDGTTELTTGQMNGPSAQENMPEFDWVNIWKTTSDGYPILRWQEEED